MRLMISDYGEGAFETLRCELDLLSDPPRVAADAVSSAGTTARRGRSTKSGLVLKGTTLKTGPFATDNPMRVTLHDFTQSEAILLARKLLEYASYLETGKVERPRARD